MPDLLDQFNKILKKDLGPILDKYLKDPNKNIPENINRFLNEPEIFLTDIFEKFSKNKNKNKNENENNPINFTDIRNETKKGANVDGEYDDLLKKLILIEENMIQIEKILKDKN